MELPTLPIELLQSGQISFFDHKVSLALFSEKKVSVTIRRLDHLKLNQNQLFITGNKFFKLKHNLIEAKRQNKTYLLSFGGAYSNHILALAKAGKQFQFKTIGIIRGDELARKPLNSTLSKAKELGMELVFVSREEYRSKTEGAFLDHLKQQFGDFYLLPEGGSNSLAIKGTAEIITHQDKTYNYICSAVGTGGTLTGIIEASHDSQETLGFLSLNNKAQIHEFIKKNTDKTNFELIENYTFGGYAKYNTELINFINEFNYQNSTPLDPIYTGKALFGVIDLTQKDFFPPKTKILFLHTGGLQSIEGFNQKLSSKKLNIK